MFTVEEISLLSTFNTFSKEVLIKDILSKQPYIEDDELKTMLSSVLKKLDGISDEEFYSCDFTPMEESIDE